MQTPKENTFLSFLVKLAVAGIIAAFAYFGYVKYTSEKTAPETPEASDVPATGTDKSTASAETVELTQDQLASIKTSPLETHMFHIEKEEVGSVAYHDKEEGNNINGGSRFVVANVLESDSPLIHVGQHVSVKALAYPGQAFEGKVSVVGVTVYDSGGNPAIDPNTHRTAVRCEVADPANRLYPGMLVSVTIDIGKPVESVAIPENGIVREGDGTMSAWVTTDRRHFMRRIVKTGIRQDGYVQILDGLQPGEQAVTDGAVFVSNLLYALPSE